MPKARNPKAPSDPSWPKRGRGGAPTIAHDLASGSKANDSTKLTGFEHCLAEWRRIHKECWTTDDPDSRQTEMMRFGYEMGRKDGRAHGK